MNDIRIYLLFITLALTACGGGGSSADNTPPPTDVASVTCTDLYNGEVSAKCKQTDSLANIVSAFFIKQAHAATVDYDAGDLSRTEFINGTMIIYNPTDFDILGYLQIIINNAGCAGETSWDLMPKHQALFKAGEEYILASGGQCGDMPLGVHSATVTAWDADGITELGKVNITFTTVE